MGQEPGTGIWLALNLNLIPGSWFLPEFLSLGTLGTSPVPHWPLTGPSHKCPALSGPLALAAAAAAPTRRHLRGRGGQ